MNKAYRIFAEYCRQHNICFAEGIDNGFPVLTIVYKAKRAPMKIIESTIWFYDKGMEVRHYYSEMGSEIVKKATSLSALYRVINYVNARVFFSCANPYGLYKPDMLYTPRFYVTEDSCGDITAATILSNDFFEVAPIETEEYLTAFCPELLDKMSAPLLMTAAGEWSEE